jgi:hypothetical protein
VFCSTQGDGNEASIKGTSVTTILRCNTKLADDALGWHPSGSYHIFLPVMWNARMSKRHSRLFALRALKAFSPPYHRNHGVAHSRKLHTSRKPVSGGLYRSTRIFSAFADRGETWFTIRWPARSCTSFSGTWGQLLPRKGLCFWRTTKNAQSTPALLADLCVSSASSPQPFC